MLPFPCTVIQKTEAFQLVKVVLREGQIHMAAARVEPRPPLVEGRADGMFFAEACLAQVYEPPRRCVSIVHPCRSANGSPYRAYKGLAPRRNAPAGRTAKKQSPQNGGLAYNYQTKLSFKISPIDFVPPIS